jgi:hypothetical protein
MKSITREVVHPVAGIGRDDRSERSGKVVALDDVDVDQLAELAAGDHRAALLPRRIEQLIEAQAHKSAG